MDKETYCEQMTKSLEDVADCLSRLAFPSPSTHDASLMLEDAKRQADQLNARIEAALAKVRALRASTDPSWEQPRQDLDRRWQEIAEEKAKFL